MLHILWLILKFILLAAATVLGILLVLLLIVLFCPVKYRAQGSKPDAGGRESIQADVYVYWLFRAVSFRFFIEGGKSQSTLRIFGIPLNKKKKNETEEEKMPLEEEVPEEPVLKERLSQPELPQEDMAKKVKEPEERREKIQSVSQSVKTKERKPGLFQRIRGKIKKIQLTLKSTCAKIEWWKKLLSNAKVQEAFGFVLGEGKKVIRHILPRKTEGKLVFGFEDPSLTGKVLALVGMWIPLHKNCVQIIPVFEAEENLYYGNIVCRGKIYVIFLLKTAAEVYFNKNVKYALYRWKHKED